MSDTTPGNITPGNTTPGNTTPGNTTPGNTTPGNTLTQSIRIDKTAMWAWTILTLLIVLFLVGLVIVSFWGGPFESDSYWRQTEAPAFPN
jgi:hypothetical protein